MTKWKVLGSLITLGFFLMGTVLWKVDQFFKNDHTVLIENQMRNQVSMSALLLGNEAQSVRNRLLNLATNGELLSGKNAQLDWKTLRPYQGVFIANSSQYRNESLGSTQANSIVNIRLIGDEENAVVGAYTERLKKQIESFIISSSNDYRTKTNNKKDSSNLRVEILVDHEKKKHLVFFLHSGDKWVGLIGPINLSQSIADIQRDSSLKMNIVNHNGVTLGHSSKDYIGSKVSVDSIFKEAEKTGIGQGRGFFEVTPNLKVLSVYQKIPNLEAYVIETIPLDSLLGEHKNLLYQIGFLFLGILTLLATVIYGLLLPIEGSFTSLRERIRAIMLGSSHFEVKTLIPEAKEINDLLTTLQTQKPIKKSSPLGMSYSSQNKTSGVSEAEIQGPPQGEDKISVYMKIVSAVGLEFRGPLTNILGYAQGILVQSPDPQIEKAAQSIVNETRGARNLLEKMFGFAGVRTPHQAEDQLSIPLKYALNKLNDLFLRKGVHLIKDFEVTPSFVMSSEDMAKAFECLLINSVEAMERMPNKELTVKCLVEGNEVVVSIVDTGEGIDRDELDKIFDPFFTTRSYSNHLGLGTSIAVGIFKELGGVVSVESERGKGTSVKITFPIPSKEKKEEDFVEISASKLSNDVPVVKDKESAMIEMFNLEKQQIELSPLDKPVFDLNIDHLLEELPEVSMPNIESKYSFLPGSIEKPLMDWNDLSNEGPVEHHKINRPSIDQSFEVEIRRPRKR